MTKAVPTPSAQKPYVVSADLGLLLSRWAHSSGFSAPSEKALETLRTRFTNRMSSMFPSFEMLDERELESGISDLVSQYGRPVISLDRVYARDGIYLELSRAVDIHRKDAGLQQRANSKSPSDQFDDIARLLVGQDVVVVDDVIFEGKVIERVTNELHTRGVRVSAVVAAVAVSEGVARIAELGIETRCLHLYDEVLDEVCERDFYPGAPFSGRSLQGHDNIGLPYIAPFGLPEQWASIPPEAALEFSRFCIEQTIQLFTEIERASERPVLCCDIPRGVFGLPRNEQRFVDVLQQVARGLP